MTLDVALDARHSSTRSVLNSAHKQTYERIDVAVSRIYSIYMFDVFTLVRAIPQTASCIVASVADMHRTTHTRVLDVYRNVAYVYNIAYSYILIFFY